MDYWADGGLLEEHTALHAALWNCIRLRAESQRHNRVSTPQQTVYEC